AETASSGASSSYFGKACAASVREATAESARTCPLASTAERIGSGTSHEQMSERKIHCVKLPERPASTRLPQRPHTSISDSGICSKLSDSHLHTAIHCVMLP